MTAAPSLRLDVVVFGGGAAGLWLLDHLHRAGHRVLLLEAHALGTGQTIGSQGIIHGGLKYSLGGLLSPSARAIREMPTVWRRSLAGETQPDLRAVRMRAEFCHLWQTRSISSRVAMLGARAGLRVAPTGLAPEARPEVLRRCPGAVARIDEQVVDPESFLAVLSDRHRDRILRIDVGSGLEFATAGPGEVTGVSLINPDSGDPLELRPARTVFAAGAGNEDLRRAVGLGDAACQRRPLHMVLARGALPVLNGHCVDGMRTRATITSARDYADRVVWQIGGQIAEDGVRMTAAALIDHARRELAAILPGFAPPALEWAAYRVDRAEKRTRGGGRPAEETALREGSTITAWPTKLALAPRLAAGVAALLPPPGEAGPPDADILSDWPRPDVAVPPWEECTSWTTDAWARPA